MWIYMFIDDALDEFEDTVTIDLFLRLSYVHLQVSFIILFAILK